MTPLVSLYIRNDPFGFPPFSFPFSFPWKMRQPKGKPKGSVQCFMILLQNGENGFLEWVGSRMFRAFFDGLCSARFRSVWRKGFILNGCTAYGSTGKPSPRGESAGGFFRVCLTA